MKIPIKLFYCVFFVVTVNAVFVRQLFWCIYVVAGSSDGNALRMVFEIRVMNDFLGQRLKYSFGEKDNFELFMGSLLRKGSNPNDFEHG